MLHDITIELKMRNIDECEIGTEMIVKGARIQLEEIVKNVSKETFSHIKEWNITMKWKDKNLTSRMLNQLNSECPVVVTMHNINEADKKNITNNIPFLEQLKETIDRNEILREHWPGFKVTSIIIPTARPTKGTLNFIYLFIFMIFLIIKLEFK